MTKSIRFLFACFFALILASMLFSAAEGINWLNNYHILALGLLFGGSGFAMYGYQIYGLDGRFGILLFTYLLCMLVLVGVVFQQKGPGFSGPGRIFKLTLIALLFLFFLGVSPRQIPYIKKTGGYLLAFSVLFAIYLYHSMVWHPSTARAAIPITAGFMMGLNVFVIPRYVSRDVFMWVVGIITSFVVLISLPAYYIGNYTFLGMNVQLWHSSFTPLLMEGKITVLQSVFGNPNTFGALAFVGTVTTAILVHRLFPGVDVGREDQPVRADGASATVLSYSFIRALGLFCLAGVMFGINAMGTYLSNSRASYLAIAISLALYFSYVSLGRRSLPYTMGALVGGFALLLLFLPQLGIDPAGRFALWSGSIEAILDNPSLLGRGIIAPNEVIDPYVGQRYSGSSPHNSYLYLFIRIGLLGGVTYLAIIAGSLLSGAIRYQQVDVPALSLTFGIAIHQMFEVYPLYESSILSMIAALAFGYLILNGSLIDEVGNEEPSEERHTGRRPRSWSRPEWNR